MITTIQLFPGVTLRCFPDPRFKQGCLSIQFLRPMRREEAALNALLPAVLLRGTESAPDLRAITLRLDDLYGASTGALVRRVGDYQTTGLCCGFMDDRYAMEGDAILEPMLQFLEDLLLHPLKKGGVFCPEYVESEKKNLISAMESRKNSKRAYATDQLFKHMCSGDSYGIPRLGEPEQVEAITPESLYRHYETILQESPMELFYVGSAQPQQVAELLKPRLEGLAKHPLSLAPQTPFAMCEGSRHTEYLDVAQGQLRMGYVTDITNRDPRFAAMQVMNAMLGSGMTSKLFMEIREKMSLCYDIGSGYHSSKGILLVSAGIDFQQEENVRMQIEKQLDACRTGDFTEEELNASKQWMLTQLEAVHDSPGAIENYYETAVLSGLAMTPDEYRQAVLAVTGQQVQEAAASLKLHTTYFLRGNDHE